MSTRPSAIAALTSCVLLLLHCDGVSSFSPLATRDALLHKTQRQQHRTPHPPTQLHGSFFDDLVGGGHDKEKAEALPKESMVKEVEGDDNHLWDTSGLQAEIERRNADACSSNNGAPTQSDSSEAVEADIDSKENEAEEVEFDGYMFRDAIYNKFGVCWDVDFQRVESYGFRKLYLNVLPFRLGSRRFRHETEYDYLCHLQAVVEILQKYDLLYSVLAQLEETKKKPRPGTSPLVAVPLRLDLSSDQLDEIMGPGM